MLIIDSHTLVKGDFSTSWYKRWAKELKQDKDHLDNHALRANKFWQNAIIVQALWERIDFTKPSVSGAGFGVGQERLPALFAKYGVHIMATDQDFTASKAKHWQKHELTNGAKSLNQLEICGSKLFKERVDYMAVDMTKIPSKLAGKYNFVWSNCALGHLGSIDAGLKFIEQSLSCLRPGGWAVHTTELNVLSNTKTADSGSTVIFRLRDIERLQKRLLSKGFELSPLQMTLGDNGADAKVSMRPQFGNDYSKIQVGGHLATQTLLIIHKPLKFSTGLNSRIARIKQARNLNSIYIQNLKKLKNYSHENPIIAEALKSQQAPLDAVKVEPEQKEVKIKIKQGETKEVLIDFINHSSIPLFSLYSRLAETKPILLGTSNPKDRASKFADKTWVGVDMNRPAHDLRIKRGQKYSLADYVKPNQNFSFAFVLNTNKLPKGIYEEELCVLQEFLGWIDGGKATLKVEVY